MPRNDTQPKTFGDDLLNKLGVEDEDEELLNTEDEGLNDEDLTGDTEPVETPEEEAERIIDAKPTVKQPKQPAPAPAPIVERVDPEKDLNPRGYYKDDGKGNLTTPEGKLVAAKGRERSIWQKMRDELVESDKRGLAVARELVKSANMLRQVWGMYKDLKDKKGYYETVGLSDEHNKMAIDLAVLSKTNPIEAAKRHLTILHMNGVDIKSLGVPGAIDAKIIADEMFKRQKELANTPKVDPGKSRDDIEAEAKAEVTEFVAKYQDSIPFLGYIAQVKDKFPEMSVEQCWLKLRETMRSQIEAEKKAKVTDPVIVRQRPNKPASNAARRNEVNTVTEASDPSMTFEDIGKQVLAELAANNS